MATTSAPRRRTRREDRHGERRGDRRGPLRRDNRGDSGLTLIEMMAAMTVVLIVLVSTIAALVTSEKSQQISEGTDRATQIAQDRMERIRQMDWADIGFHPNKIGTPPADYATYAPPGSEDRVNIANAAAAVPGCTTTKRTDILCPYYLDTSLKNPMKVYTHITWGRDASLGLPSTSADGAPYSFKRVKIVVDWTPPGGTQRRLTINETWFSPDAEDAIPPGVPIYEEP